MAYLFFDVETTGLPDFKAPIESEFQPRVVQLAAIMTDEENNVMTMLSALIKPDGWTVPEKTTELTGITQDMVENYGLGIGAVISAFARMREQADLLIGHNISFDLFMVRREAIAAGVDMVEAKYFCTMKETTAICNLPPSDSMIDAGFHKPKPPKLVEAYAHFFGRPFENAHNALADVQACRDVFFALRNNHPATQAKSGQ